MLQKSYFNHLLSFEVVNAIEQRFPPYSVYRFLSDFNVNRIFTISTAFRVGAQGAGFILWRGGFFRVAVVINLILNCHSIFAHRHDGSILAALLGASRGHV